MAVDRLIIDLEHILRQFPDLEFSMADFEHRLRIQKFVYLLQAFGVYLGYDYSWYLHGPHCTGLAAVGCAPGPICDMLPYDKDAVFDSPAAHWPRPNRSRPLSPPAMRGGAHAPK